MWSAYGFETEEEFEYVPSASVLGIFDMPMPLLHALLVYGVPDPRPRTCYHAPTVVVDSGKPLWESLHECLNSLLQSKTCCGDVSDNFYFGGDATGRRETR